MQNLFGKNDLNIFVHVIYLVFCNKKFHKGAEILMKIMFYYYYDMIRDFMILIDT